MQYISTRGEAQPVSAEQAVINGIAPDGGLYVPEIIPHFTEVEKLLLPKANYRDTAFIVLHKFLPGFSKEELTGLIEKSYSKFDGSNPAPITPIKNHVSVLELWHGPTSAFKDMALQMLPHLLVLCKEKCHESVETKILVATSGDTGKAALEGFCDVDGTSITVFYPQKGVSEVQEAQMVRQKGKNVNVIAIDGNFDDAQSAVKELFGDNDLRQKLAGRNCTLSSANSINWGRLLPQIVYYVYASYRNQEDHPHTCSFVVPTGNFGNILAAYYAKLMGSPINQLVCASNQNNILTDFLSTGIYDKNREFYKTISPSMDILISSNLERLLFEVSNHNSALVSALMNSLKKNGKYEISRELLQSIQKTFCAHFSTDQDTKETIQYVYSTYRYLLDPHSAIAYNAYRNFCNRLKDEVVVVSTASPFKFAGDVLTALGLDNKTGFEAIDCLAARTGITPPSGLTELTQLPVRFTTLADPKNLKEFI